jgi:hypothetical protein
MQRAGARGARRFVLAVVAVGIAASGCGDLTRSRIEEASSTAAPAATAVASATSEPRAHVRGTLLRERRLREYRRMIVALYRVPGSSALNRRYADPFDQLWHGLGTMYGPVLRPRPGAAFAPAVDRGRGMPDRPAAAVSRAGRNGVRS